MFDWSAEQYGKFEKERTLPAVDLANAIVHDDVRKVIDIGCGIGNSTAVLAEKYPNAEIVGIDNSEDMLAAARKNNPGIVFKKLDVEKELDKIDGHYDVIFSNACLQWIPNHPELLKGLFALLNDRGVLAVQIPQQSKHPVHRIMRSIVETEAWCSKIFFRRAYNNLTEQEYFDVLSELSDNFRIWEITYFFSMPSYQSISEWYQGTGLRPYLTQLSSKDREKFLYEFLKRVKETYPVQKSGKIIFKFPRLFFTVTK